MTLTVTRVHGSNTQVGTLYNPNASLYIITVQDATSTAINLQTQDSYGGDAKVNGVIEAIVDELNPLAWFSPVDASGVIHVVMDKAINSASELTIRIRRIGLLSTGLTSVGPDNIDISGTTVSEATSFTVSA